MHLPSLFSVLSVSLSLSSLVAATTTEELPNGLKIEKIHTVDCERRTLSGDSIKVHYRGTLAESGKQFDASYDRGSPLSFMVGTGMVIQGWDQGLIGMCVGDKRKLTIPPELGYGNRAMGPIPAGSTLIFETELMEIEGVKKDEL
ncbi:Peptidyl-prolyl cis-trans isomerase fpr2 [Coccidioides posadasii str. Silveira]|uniref:peptidylprolyl isomerase n=3 Tax=Coccidioides posadasii TaxID=199306 RepID=E9DC87_COCPS|nr:FK506-binding protein 2 precursor/ peptidyl-prolyl cis-trans isomerase, putative [Coccidioides posadasii C735 delta SOWgp]EER23070.1 FK506-binding protein 2 precursor/ peptidyl-prolyl cis-trans isomerase, putative [Coccidioides posadasii C735 delta SOWgp]EFW15812.1 FKBP-type peptidyl-prolyl isomerase [Coccidioides posadasii str. Silveira]KMM69122.1 FK506-binding protein 2 [Coccidioides posadasii RMSCC 3488]QVM09715.1 Peptidyl-prolyl cis-trans isomerase fpr2 [Coccidioides posadasii str. Silve|eukprot:XP_003065215.1 FK506-binding protein 2 precursor/ peptidyl-prolyl cis-trans isomerase, putative [Coccidioides posadasii C735 delta SOWgp]